MEYFEVSEKPENQSGLCSDPKCPCPNTKIPAGEDLRGRSPRCHPAGPVSYGIVKEGATKMSKKILFLAVFALSVIGGSVVYAASIDEELISAVERGDVAAAQALLLKGADVNAKGRLGNTVLMTAAYKGCPDVAKGLVARGADVNAKNDFGGSALDCASHSGNLEIVQLLLANGADVNAKSDDGQTALMAAAFKGHPEIVKALLANGADVNSKNKEGWGAVMFAATEDMKGNVVPQEIRKEVISLLKEAGAKSDL